MDDAAPPSTNYPLARSSAKMSKTPSWVMLGFLLGALFVYAMMRNREPATPSTVAVRIVEAPKPVAPRAAPLLSTVEAVFEVWGEHAIWSENLTEVALWNSAEAAFSDYYEVRRVGGVNYFRSIPRLTRRVLTHGKEMPDSPLQFTETEEQYREWFEFGRSERRSGPETRITPAVPPQVSRSQVTAPQAPTPRPPRAATNPGHDGKK